MRCRAALSHIQRKASPGTVLEQLAVTDVAPERVHRTVAGLIGERPDAGAVAGGNVAEPALGDLALPATYTDRKPWRPSSTPHAYVACTHASAALWT